MTGLIICSAVLAALIVIAVFALSFISFRRAVRDSHQPF